MALTWEDSEDIAIELADAHPEVDPLSVRFTDLHRWVVELPGFSDDPQASTEGKLERIQMAWLEESKEPSARSGDNHVGHAGEPQGRLRAARDDQSCAPELRSRGLGGGDLSARGRAEEVPREDHPGAHPCRLGGVAPWGARRLRARTRC